MCVCVAGGWGEKEGLILQNQPLDWHLRSKLELESHLLTFCSSQPLNENLLVMLGLGQQGGGCTGATNRGSRR